MKKSKTVIEVETAENAEAAALAVWRAAAAETKQAEQAYYASQLASQEARIKADETLQQCKMVSVGWTGNEKDDGRVAILKMTPKGQLVVRRVGVRDGNYRFRLDKYTGRWIQAERYIRFSANRELRDVPAEYLPQTENGISDELRD